MMIIYLLLYLWIFWYAYVLVMGLYRAHLSKRLNTFTKILALPALIIGVTMDVLAQFTIACIFFFELPKIELGRGKSIKIEWLVTTRLQRYMTYPKGWRKEKADWICTHLLDPFDPTGDHC